jgi:3-deoxy-D-arabino-heptulosonate 7-phosphate (DAHP) synthase
VRDSAPPSFKVGVPLGLDAPPPVARLQPLVAADIAQQMRARDGSQHNIFGVMIESHLVAGRQDLTRARCMRNAVRVVSCVCAHANVRTISPRALRARYKRVHGWG